MNGLASSACDKLDAATVIDEYEKTALSLGKAPDAIEVQTYGEVDSVMDCLKRLECADTERRDRAAVCESQSAGRGRLGRNFYSPQGTGLYMGILLHPTVMPALTAGITTAAAVACSLAIEQLCGESTGIKWVNDIFVRGKKVCGILTESALSGSGSGYVVIGIGINVYPPVSGFPDNLENVANAVMRDARQKRGLRSRLMGNILARLVAYCADLRNPEIVREYKRRCFVVGKAVRVFKGENQRDATAVALDDELRLVVDYGNGETETLFGGEISVRVRG